MSSSGIPNSQSRSLFVRRNSIVWVNQETNNELNTNPPPNDIPEENISYDGNNGNDGNNANDANGGNNGNNERNLNVDNILNYSLNSSRNSELFSSTLFDNNQRDRKSLNMVEFKNRLKEHGWYLPDSTLKYNMFNRGKYLHCYVCEDLASYCQVGASKTIPRYLMDMAEVNITSSIKMENIFILCHKCIMDDYLIEAPRNYKSLVNYKKRKTSWFSTQLKINSDLEKEVITMYDEEFRLRGQLSTLTDENNIIKQRVIDLQSNIEIESEKYHRYNDVISENGKLINNLTSESDKMEKYVKNATLKCKSNITKTQLKMNELYDNYIKKVQENANILDSIFQMENSSEAPCQICRVKKIGIFLDPCGHCLCTNCSDMIINDGKCPYCKTIIMEHKKMFLGF